MRGRGATGSRRCRPGQLSRRPPTWRRWTCSRGPRPSRRPVPYSGTSGRPCRCPSRTRRCAPGSYPARSTAIPRQGRARRTRRRCRSSSRPRTCRLRSARRQTVRTGDPCRSAPRRPAYPTGIPARRARAASGWPRCRPGPSLHLRLALFCRRTRAPPRCAPARRHSGTSGRPFRCLFRTRQSGRRRGPAAAAGPARRRRGRPRRTPP